MSRTTLCLLTATLLAALAVGLLVARLRALGDEVFRPGGPGAWKITLVVQGRTTGGDARVHTATPLEMPGQHLLSELGRSDEFRAPTAGPPGGGRRLLLWEPKPGTSAGSFRLHYECYCTLPGHHADQTGPEAHPHHYAPPAPGELLRSEPGMDADHPEIAALARRLTDGVGEIADQAEALFRYVEQEVTGEPRLAGGARSAVECLRLLSGDSAAKSRLLAALLRNRGIPARLVVGLTLARADEETEHVWVEAWLRDHWLPMCPFYRYFGRVPRTFLVFGFGDIRLVTGKNLGKSSHAFLVERLAERPGGAEPSLAHRAFVAGSLMALAPGQQRVVEFLLLLPVAAFIICVFRNLIGLNTFGTFAPALVGLAFREYQGTLRAGSGWAGPFVFVTVLLLGWLLRRSLSRFHLLQVPRTAFLLSLVVAVLLVAIRLTDGRGLPVAESVALFPMVILVGMIERFWTLEEEEGAAASFRTLLSTLLIAGCISVVVSRPALARWLLACPELLGLVMAGQLMLGRYTGYRLLELYRFREFLAAPPTPALHVFRDRGEVEGPRF